MQWLVSRYTQPNRVADGLAEPARQRSHPGVGSADVRGSLCEPGRIERTLRELGATDIGLLRR